MNKTYFIADISANHDGSLKRAKKLCLLAKQSGADAAKFQHFKAESIINDNEFKKINNISHQNNWKKSVYETYKDASIPLEWTHELKNYCDDIQIDFFTTPYDLEYVDYLDQYVSMYKIGSGDITWIQMLEKVASKNKPVMIATGASTIEEVDRAIKILSKKNIKIILMQCNTNYTNNIENFKYINLNVLKTYANRYPNILLGLSDHTEGYVTTLGAVALGAKYVEKHFTDDNSRIGPDHEFSMNPEKWKEMVDNTRLLESALGDGIKKLEYNEQETVILQRRSIRLNKSLSKGDIITKNDIAYLRPCPIDAWPIHIDPIGMTLSNDVNQNNYLKNNDLK